MSGDVFAATSAVQSDVVTPVDHAFDQLSTGLDHLIKVVEDGGLDHYDDNQLVRFHQAFETLRARMPIVEHHIITHEERRDLPGRRLQPNLVQLLSHMLRLSAAEASRRVRAAQAVGPRASAVGAPLDPIRSVLGAAQRDGAVSTEQVAIIERALRSVDRPGFDPEDIAAGEALLTEFATRFGPKDLRNLADQVVAAIDPDGSVPNDDLNHDRRHLLLRPGADGAYAGQLRLTGALGAKLTAVLTPLAKPRVDTLSLADGSDHEERDARTYGQRMHDALEELCDRALRAGGLPDSGGTPATVIVTLTMQDLLDRTGVGESSDGGKLSTTEILALAGQADVIPTVLSRTGAVLDLGRSRRVATASQTLALIARDGGCSFPGCAHPPEFCERHHIVGWVDGGETNLANLTLLCRYHHHNFVSRGWTCRLNADGLPEWLPPRWLDRTRQPLVNTRILARAANTRDLVGEKRRT
jgi:hypothetical protein